MVDGHKPQPKSCLPEGLQLKLTHFSAVPKVPPPRRKETCRCFFYLFELGGIAKPIYMYIYKPLMDILPPTPRPPASSIVEPKPPAGTSTARRPSTRRRQKGSCCEGVTRSMAASKADMGVFLGTPPPSKQTQTQVPSKKKFASK